MDGINNKNQGHLDKTVPQKIICFYTLVSVNPQIFCFPLKDFDEVGHSAYGILLGALGGD